MLESLLSHKKKQLVAERLANNIETQRILNSAQHARCKLKLHFPNFQSKVKYSSLVLDVNLKENFIIIDEIIPKDYNAPKEVGQVISCSGTFHGIVIDFHATIEKIIKEKKFTYYQLNFPENLKYDQQRSAFRVKVSSARELNVTIRSTENENLIARLKDISVGGFQIALPEDQEHFVENDNSYDSVLIEVPKEPAVLCKAMARHIDIDEDLQVQRIGFQFLELEGMAQRNINRFVNGLQREAKRKEQGDDFMEY